MCKKTFFSNFNFWTTLFSKIMPNFWWTVSHRRIFLKEFPLSMLILGQKSCILGPIIFNFPQPNWHYCVCHSIRSMFRILGMYNFGPMSKSRHSYHLTLKFGPILYEIAFILYEIVCFAHSFGYQISVSFCIVLRSTVL